MLEEIDVDGNKTISKEEFDQLIHRKNVVKALQEVAPAVQVRINRQAEMQHWQSPGELKGRKIARSLIS